MALKVTGFSATGLPYKIVHESASTATLLSNVTGAAGKIHTMDLDVGNANTTSYLKIFVNAAAAISDPADIKIRLRTGANGVKRFNMPKGIDFTEFSFYTTSTHGTANSPAVPQATAIHSFTTT